ncbi:Retinol dehydrogenase 10-B [Frankliniella fusca]|uniref:Retinol dehydrogenase 10-B n=1 Tax=Frankliniella fusca TaxID=407009 RepID=A0AAE1I4J3_9NEOP|nr:Retinol dehydrogenase 10-B [Frankliniella fusca]
MTTCGPLDPGRGGGDQDDQDDQDGLEQQLQRHGPIITSFWSWLLGARGHGGGCLRGKRALVSGSGGGLGRELSLQLVRQSCRVICIDQDAAKVQETLGLASSLEADGVPEGSQGSQGSTGGARLARGYACDWRNPGEALGLSRAVTTTEGGVDLIFVVPENNNNNESAVDGAGKVIGNEFWPLLGFLPGMLARARGHVVHILDEQIAHKTGASDDMAEWNHATLSNVLPQTEPGGLVAGLVADAWLESLREVGADVRYTKVHLHADQARHHPCRAEDAARAIVSAVRRGSADLHLAYPVC